MKPHPSPCELVTERVALGEPLGELASHLATCASCKRTVAMPRSIAAVAARPDPGLGFSARMTIGAQHRYLARRKRRIAAYAASTVAAAAAVVFVVTRTPSSSDEVATTRPATLDLAPKEPATQVEAPVPVVDSELADLVRLADIKRARRERAPWGRIQKPLKPYIKLVKGVAP